MKALLADYDDDGLQDLMTNLAGHDMEAGAGSTARGRFPTFLIASSRTRSRASGCPSPATRDNHAGIMNEEQMADFRASMHVDEGSEWSRFAGLGLDEGDPGAVHRCGPLQPQAGPAFGAGCAAARRAALPPRPPHVHAGGLRPHSQRARQGREPARRAHRHHLARCHGLHQPRRLGEPARHLRPRRPARTSSAPRRSSRCRSGRSAGTASTSSSVSPRTISSSCSPRSG